MRAFLYVLTFVFWISGAALYIGSMEYPQDSAQFIAVFTKWLEPRIGIAINTTPEHIAGGLVVIASSLFYFLRGFTKKSPKANNRTSLLSEIEKNAAKLNQDLDNAEQAIDDASRKLAEQVAIAEAKAAELQNSRQRLAALRNQCADLLQIPASPVFSNNVGSDLAAIASGSACGERGNPSPCRCGNPRPTETNTAMTTEGEVRIDDLDIPDILNIPKQAETAKSSLLDNDTLSQLWEWQRFYEKVWGIEQNLFELSIPVRQEGFSWLVVMLKGMTARRIVDKIHERMKFWIRNEKDLDRITSDRELDYDYAIWLRGQIEANEELNLSRDDLKAQGVNYITLPERLMLELFYYWKTNEHLDIKNWTLCAGSLYPGGRIPSVHWNSSDGEVGVGWCHSRGDGDPRCRAVIS